MLKAQTLTLNIKLHDEVPPKKKPLTLNCSSHEEKNMKINWFSRFHNKVPNPNPKYQAAEGGSPKTKP